MFNITLQTKNQSLTIYFDKNGGLSSAKRFATRVANALKYKVTGIIIYIEAGNSMYTVAAKDGERWLPSEYFDMNIKQYKVKA